MQSLSIGLAPMQADPVVTLGGNINLLWVVIGAVLVIFMQAGFALVETGFCRAKNAAHVVSTNFAIFGLGFIGFFFVGFPLAFSAGLQLLGVRARRAGRRARCSAPATGSSCGKGGWALSGDGITPALLALLPLHGGLHGHHRHDPDRGRWRSVGSGAAS